jgi:hypothetical protein
LLDTSIDKLRLEWDVPSKHSDTIVGKFTTITKDFDNGYTLGLFCRNSKGTYQRPINGRLYYLVIEENGTEIMHLLPCRRKSDSVVGLYDIVGNKFLTSLNPSVPFKAPTSA